MARRSFRIYRDRASGWHFTRWRWECTLCRPPARGYRRTWIGVVTISLPHHFRCRQGHHARMAQIYPSEYPTGNAPRATIPPGSMPTLEDGTPDLGNIL